jgi:hypothetical protein
MVEGALLKGVAIDAPAKREARADGEVKRERTAVQLQSTSPRILGKTEGYQRPESKTNQQDREPCKICKTSIPGSNPGGASKILKKIANRAQVETGGQPILFPNCRRHEREY